MQLTRSSKWMAIGLAAIAALGAVYLVARHDATQKPLVMHVAFLPLTRDWDTATSPKLEQLAAVNKETMARYHPEREVEHDKYVETAYGPNCQTRIERKRLRLGEAVIGSVALSRDGFSEMVLSGGSFGEPVRVRLQPGSCTISECADIWLDATICTPMRKGRSISDGWWISEYEQEVSRPDFVIEGEVYLPGEARAITLERTDVDQKATLATGPALAKDGTLFCGVTTWNPLLDRNSPDPNKLAELLPDVWRAYTPNRLELPKRAVRKRAVRVSKEPRTVVRYEVETAELSWPVKDDVEPETGEYDAVPQQLRGPKLAGREPVDVKGLELAWPLFSFLEGRSGEVFVSFVACRDLAGAVQAGETCYVYRDEARIVQVATLTLEADFWITRVRGEDGEWRVEKEQFHNYTITVGPEEQRVYGWVHVGGKVVSLGPENYSDTD